MIDLFGVRIQEDPYLPDGACVVIGHFDKPADWDTKTESEQMAYAVAHGALVMVKSLASFRARAVGEAIPSTTRASRERSERADDGDDVSLHRPSGDEAVS